MQKVRFEELQTNKLTQEEALQELVRRNRIQIDEITTKYKEQIKTINSQWNERIF